MGFGKWQPSLLPWKLLRSSQGFFMQELLEKLRKRAIKGLSNIEEIDDDLLQISLGEAEQVCKNKIVPDYIKIDLAYIRMKLYMKIELNGEDEMLYKDAMRIIKESSINHQDQIVPPLFYKSETRDDK